MNKKVLVISSSPRKGGNSDTLCNQFIKGANESNNIVDKIDLRNYKIGYCTGCGSCSVQHKPCPQKDDAAEIIQKIIDSDVIVMATPVYFYSICAQLKTLIDRCCSRYLEISNKEFYFILTAAENNKDDMQPAIACFDGFLHCLDNPKKCNTIYGLGAWHIGDIENNEAMNIAYKCGKDC